MKYATKHDSTSIAHRGLQRRRNHGSHIQNMSISSWLNTITLLALIDLLFLHVCIPVFECSSVPHIQQGLTPLVRIYYLSSPRLIDPTSLCPHNLCPCTPRLILEPQKRRSYPPMASKVPTRRFSRPPQRGGARNQHDDASSTCSDSAGGVVAIRLFLRPVRRARETGRRESIVVCQPASRYI